MENRSVYNSTIFLPPSIVEHVNRQTSDIRKTGTYIQTHALPLNQSESSKQSFQIAHERMAQTDKNHIDVNRTDALHQVTFIIARSLLKITHQCLANKAATTPTTIKQRSRHQHAIGIAACERVQ